MEREHNPEGTPWIWHRRRPRLLLGTPTCAAEQAASRNQDIDFGGYAIVHRRVRKMLDGKGHLF